ncbi:MAG: hypothetical protein AAF206_28590, partial [Bacteroidota bacterium]
MNTKHIVGLFLFCLLTTTSFGQNQGRNVFWIQGMGQSGNAWQEYENRFGNERCMNSVSDNISNWNVVRTTDGIPLFTNRIRTEMNLSLGAAGVGDPQNIAVGHSAGGITARAIVRDHQGNSAQYPQTFGGIITVGSPNNGADLVNSYENGDVAAVLN